MRINEFTYNKETMLQVYVTNDEIHNPSILSKLEELKKQYKHIGIFVSGKKDFKEVASNILSSASHF